MQDTVTPDQIREFTLRDGDVAVSLLNLGTITRRWRVVGNDGPVDIVLGYEDPAAYLNNPSFLGIIAGRVANRIAAGQFQLEGKTHQIDVNEPPNTLHGGTQGLGTRLWAAEIDGPRSVQFTYHSPEGECGFPGAVDFAVEVVLDGPRLTYYMSAKPDRPTPINLAQHSYYNLVGAGEIGSHHLKIRANHVTPVDAAGIPSGALMSVDNTKFDLREGPALADALAEGGLDHNYVLTQSDRPSAVLTGPNGLQLQMWTDQPGLQLYTSGGLAPLHKPLAGQDHQPNTAVCLEPQLHPDAINQPGFPNCIATPDAPYHQVLTIEVAQT
ncbi:hypothetical protein ACMU_00640 [Actibacterium mucosum KCTC 23349]|uniref:Aldose 1-epimerase n=1 Tax=Actibacterium mucosum KCTC 23349 TaxID=1454373 RepID=A0A037ZKR7_9RHOB|nr:aldose epimerase family protein [Actibacterium mucosum]KAJ57031.1 hypothetical protein ACMU_00640 [Actibacterium mucosum KCTC 23349]